MTFETKYKVRFLKPYYFPGVDFPVGHEIEYEGCQPHYGVKLAQPPDAVTYFPFDCVEIVKITEEIVLPKDLPF